MPVLSFSLPLATAGVASAAPANAVIPTSASPGTSPSVINNYQEVTMQATDDGSWPCGGGGNAAVACPGPDGETGPTLYPFGFNINFYGAEYSSAYINENGNLTFNNYLSQYTPSDLTTLGGPILAPFFADFDSRGTGNNDVNFGQGTLNGQKVFVVNWPGVGCFSANASVLDDVQMVLIDRPDLGTGGLGDAFEIEYNYDSIQWDAGEASGGNASCQDDPDAGYSAYVGYSNGTSTPGDSYTLTGSGVSGAFLDSNAATGLANNDLNSDVIGRYIWNVIAGQPTTVTTLTTSLAGGGQSGGSVTVPESTGVTDSALLAGTNAATASGQVTYNVYSDAACTDLVTTGGAVTVTDGSVPASSAVSLTTPGTYYWQASYNGDTLNNGSLSACGSEVETVTAPVVAAPTVTLVIPPQGPTFGVIVVVVKGTNLTAGGHACNFNNMAPCGTSVDFGGTPATSVLYASPTFVAVEAPAGSLGTVDVTVSVNGGTASATSAADKFTYVSGSLYNLAYLEARLTATEALLLTYPTS
jgi:hypothetical protein